MTIIADRLAGLEGAPKRAILVAYDGSAMFVALWLAFCVRLGIFYRPAPAVLLLWAAAAVAGVVALLPLGVYRVVIRYLHIRSALRLIAGAAAAAAIWFVLAYLSRIPGLPRSIGFIYFAAVFLLMFFGRLTASYLLTRGLSNRDAVVGQSSHVRRIPVAIQGANEAGCSLAESLRRHPQYKLRFFVDDSSVLTGRVLLGYPVVSSARLRRDVAVGEIEQVFLAMPSASRSERLEAFSNLSKLAVRVLTVPAHEEIVSGRYAVSDVRPVKVEDLLKRDIVPPLAHLIEGGIKDKIVLVTGAGGSIGSEICRQVLRHSPKCLVLFDHSEFSLFAIHSELQRICTDKLEGYCPDLVPIMGSLLDERLVEEVLDRFGIDTVFHAAAYKHVPLLEDNEVVGVANNVLGTRILADGCVKARVARMTMISTDKAVRPTSVMGSSKRVAELYIQALAGEPDTRTSFGIVRFGNVLDSSGSVVQEFRKQIRDGGPVTVTHENITRFFMSIPEATQLVLQANSMANHGEVFVLDMGEPVRIADLARTMIALSGMSEKTQQNPTGDIEIQYVGLRPGEKLHEELFVGQEITNTDHPQIKMARERSISLADLQPQIETLTRALKARDADRVRSLLKELIAQDRQELARA